MVNVEINLKSVDKINELYCGNVVLTEPIHCFITLDEALESIYGREMLFTVKAFNEISHSLFN
jgi:hypothetical protein